eukprot:CAMPEP_0114231146 /NCGR_PEP_ID=MMETSP0058-20121206/3867_1 /TAXON_ID=36894 /ORGANISM="Pyramimonas parkeae, CCMP726" /LENGTH=91 /DNA_ID=CAMNT_0001342433 /DNA_START=497 /DNA_END=769 /DNA_ORIENTATION=-
MGGGASSAKAPRASYPAYMMQTSTRAAPKPTPQSSSDTALRDIQNRARALQDERGQRDSVSSNGSSSSSNTIGKERGGEGDASSVPGTPTR